MKVLSRLRTAIPELSLIGITVIWGASFIVVQFVVTQTGVLFLMGGRFAVAAALTSVLFARYLRGLTAHEVLAGGLIGLSIFIGYGLQAYGLQTIPSSTSAFLTTLYVPLIPLLQWAVFRRPPHLFSWLGIALAFIGLLLITGEGIATLSLSRGEVATILCVLGVAAEIMLISYFAPTVDSRRVTIVQLWIVAILAFGTMAATSAPLPAFSWGWVAGLVALGAASALIQLVMNWAQRTVSPTRATVIYTGEPVWAGLIGRIAGERLAPLALLGGVVIVIGVLISELGPTLFKKPRRKY
ncbi:putative integral membrane protein [Ketogulonicigenium robustum]|uniref:Putative integral membrane protein n=1 Tax=Ketogulonicigenium robustum TaxID=92947 RepID=A0A1W6NZ47_9RHOB|nr:DMT family transporter [Ketogulonicigenium robustum]ARO14474.1 putative integral membrane protein [Ketogulonicigenium robustum]